MVMENNKQDRPTVQRTIPPRPFDAVGSLPPQQRGNMGGGGNGGGIGKQIVYALLALLISCGFTWYSVNNTNTQLETVAKESMDSSSKVTQLSSSVQTSVNGIPDLITAQVNLAIESYDTRLETLESNNTEYATADQFDTLQDKYDTLQGKYNTLQGQYTTLQGQYTTLKSQSDAQTTIIQNLSDIINESDLQHKNISVTLSDYTGFEPYIGQHDASGNYTTANITLTIKNNTTNSITLKDLVIDLNPNLNYGSLSGFNILKTRLRSLIGAGDVSQIILAFNNYHIGNPNIIIGVGATRNIVLQYYVYFSITSNISEADINAFIDYSMSIYPHVTLVSYILN